MTVQSYKDLNVWQAAMNLVTDVYRQTESFPKHELFGLVSQIRRCAVSIPSNVAEGSRRGTRKDFRHFVLIAYGSGAELETQLEVAKRLGYISNEFHVGLEQKLTDIMRMLNGLTRSLDEQS
ncbi:MAG: four helix bundle protein [Candidatus Uhrbacteria bacterium]